MICAYCRQEAKGTKEHIISRAILNLFPECNLTIDGTRDIVHMSDPVIKDVCADCNNTISYIDNYAKGFIGAYFTKKYSKDDVVTIEYDYIKIQKMLLKYAFNDMRSHKNDCSFFDEEMLQYIMDECIEIPQKNISVLCGFVVNVSHLPDAMFGNLKLQWCKDPFFYSSNTIRYINIDTEKFTLNKDIKKEEFPDLNFSYIFRFNSVQFLLMCWDKNSKNIILNNIAMNLQYPYYLMKPNDSRAVLPLCTNMLNYHHFALIHPRI